ncbi:MAG TPA: nucleotide disphospho-sugar-binding domain-containing protein [Thermomonospora sp.]|nr:nucleotide disphospho-sugar-binding domain-containing protein [Thermomonospora sp.]
MRVLFLTTPLVSHTFPLVPLAWAMRAAGHDVLFGTTGPALSVAEAGVHVADFDPDGECPSVAELNSSRPDIVRHRATKVADGWPLLIEVTRRYADHMIALAETWRPDLVVHSQLQGSGLLAAAKVGVPAVEHRSSLLRGDDYFDRLPELIEETFAAHGLAGLPERRVSLEVAPPSMAAPRDDARPLRYIPFNGGGLLPPDLTGPPGRPRIVVTVGTTIMAPDMALLVERTLAAAPKVEAEFVVLLAGMDEEAVPRGRPPANVRILREWVPLRPLLDGSAAILHHGGAGSILAALDAGVPQLVVPSGAPNFLQADVVRERGAGIVAEAADLDAALLERLLDDPGTRAAAGEVRAEMARMPSPAEAVGPLLAWAA